MTQKYGFIFQRTIYIPQPTWGNHPKVFALSGLFVKTYRYYDPATRGLNFQGTKFSFPSFSAKILHSIFIASIMRATAKDFIRLTFPYLFLIQCKMPLGIPYNF